jgi:hypothetical protein
MGCLNKFVLMTLTRGLLVVVLTGFSRLGIAIDNHCAKDESVIFNCSTGKKTGSVCASKAISTTSGYLQYRFGRLGAPELTIPIDMKLPSADIQANTLIYSGGGGAYIRFNNQRFSYVVYTAIGRGWGEKAGIAVEKDHQLQVNLPCKMPLQSELGPDFFDRAGLMQDQIGFDLP